MEADLEAEPAPPPAPAPKPAPKPASVAGVSPSEALEWTGSRLCGCKIELVQEDGYAEDPGRVVALVRGPEIHCFPAATQPPPSASFWRKVAGSIIVAEVRGRAGPAKNGTSAPATSCARAPPFRRRSSTATPCSPRRREYKVATDARPLRHAAPPAGDGADHVERGDYSAGPRERNIKSTKPTYESSAWTPSRGSRSRRRSPGGRHGALERRQRPRRRGTAF